MKKHELPVFQKLSSGGVDVSGVTATAGDVDEGKIFVDSSGQEVEGTSTYKTDYTTLNTLVIQTTATAEDVAQGKLFVNSSGVQTTGTATSGNEDFIKMVERQNNSSITIPNGTTQIGDRCFLEDPGLASVTMPNTITSIGKYAFKGCYALESVGEFPSVLTNIGEQAFNGCEKLVITKFPSSLKTIGYLAFKGCIAITSITFGSKPDDIAQYAFYDCNNLRTINAPWSAGQVSNAPWGATNATINYNYTP